MIWVDGDNVITILAIQFRFGGWQAIDLWWFIELTVED